MREVTLPRRAVLDLFNGFCGRADSGQRNGLVLGTLPLANADHHGFVGGRSVHADAPTPRISEDCLAAGHRIDVTLATSGEPDRRCLHGHLDDLEGHLFTSVCPLAAEAHEQGRFVRPVDPDLTLRSVIGRDIGWGGEVARPVEDTFCARPRSRDDTCWTYRTIRRCRGGAPDEAQGQDCCASSHNSYVQGGVP